jgi:hypothetical protein
MQKEIFLKTISALEFFQKSVICRGGFQTRPRIKRSHRMLGKRAGLKPAPTKKDRFKPLKIYSINFF